MKFRNFSLVLSVMMFSACSLGYRQIQTSVNNTAKAINQEFVAVKKTIIEMSKNINTAYEKRAEYDLSIDKLDIENGGIFTTFKNNSFYYKVTNLGASYYLSPMKPVTEDMKKDVKMATYIEVYMENAWKNHSDIIYMVFLGFDKPYNLALLYPWYDMVSAFPPEVKLTNFEWYRRGLESSGNPIWSELPFTDLYNGWIVDIAIPVKTNNTIMGASVISLGIRKINEKFLTKQKQNLILLGPEMSLLGISPGVRDIFKVKVLEDVNYTRQIIENTFVQDEFKLSHENQPDIFKKLAQAIQDGKNQFRITDEQEDYFFTIAKIPETGWYVVGVVKD